MTYCRKTEYKLSLQTGWKAWRTLRKLCKRREKWWKKHSDYIRFLENYQRHNEYETEEILDGRYGVIFSPIFRAKYKRKRRLFYRLFYVIALYSMI